jgi:FAD-dependent urate hydroxylase
MARMSSGIRTALIAGGGIAGPTAGIALTQAGIEATVYEAYQSSASGVGGALSIAPNGLDALDAIGAGGAVRRIGTPINSIVVQSWSGRRLAEFGTPPGCRPCSSSVVQTSIARWLRRPVHVGCGSFTASD